MTNSLSLFPILEESKFTEIINTMDILDIVKNNNTNKISLESDK